MNYPSVLVLACMLFATNVPASDLDYTLEVKGMVCAYCAYNVSKQLKSLDGVVPDSVSVDLENGKVTLQSEKKLETTRLSKLLQKEGFSLGTVSETISAAMAARRKSDGSVVMSLTVDTDRLVDGQFDTMLEALGTIAAQRSGRISVVGPGELEETILKPVLAGRRTVIKVEYDRMNRPDNTIRINLIVD